MNIQEAILNEQARYLHRNLLPTGVFNGIVATAVVVLFDQGLHAAYRAAFMTMFAALALASAVLWRSFRLAAYTPAEALRLLRLSAWLHVLWSVFWTGVIYALFDANRNMAFFCAVLVTGVGSIFSLSLYLPAFAANLLPMALTSLYVVGRQATMSDPMWITLQLYLPIILAFAWRFNRFTLASLRLRFDNAALVAELTIQREAAESAVQAKSIFLAAASHDLRQPMHALGLFLSSLQRTVLSAKQRELVTHIETSTNAARTMLDTLLDFSKLEAGSVMAHPIAFPLQAMLHKLENEFAVQAERKDLVYRSRDTDIIAYADPSLLELVLRNLISNAIRYTESGGLLIACRRRTDAVTVEVWDTGVGIPASQHRDIFREFYQLANPERDRNKGLGLGLAIVDGLMRTMGLPITVASVPGRGSVFRVTLPLGTAPDDAQPVAPARPAPARQLAGRRVLLVDDDQAVRLAMMELLDGWGCHCLTMESMEEAVDALSVFTPELVITDYRLRGHRTGQEVLAAIGAHLRHPVPAIVVTGDTAPQRLRDAQASGAVLLHKPVAPAALLAAMTMLLHDAAEAVPMAS